VKRLIEFLKRLCDKAEASNPERAHALMLATQHNRK